MQASIRFIAPLTFVLMHSKGLYSAVGTIFVAAAIETSMAEEIWEQLESGVLTNAANLTKDDQLIELCSWLLEI